MRRRFFVFSLLFLLPSSLSAQDAARSTLQAFVDSNDISGAVAVVGSKNGPPTILAVGLQNLEQDSAMTEKSLFRIASMTKPITAMGIMMLVDDGKLSIDDPVEKHLPEFKGQMVVAERGADTVTLKKPSRPITIKNLLTHTSGMPAPPPGLSDLYQKRGHTLAEGVMAFSQRPLDFEPGSRWAYCNPGIDTLGRIIEVVSGQSYEDFLAKRLFEPLGMVDTTFYPNEKNLPRLAVIYDKKDGKLTPAATAIIQLPRVNRYPIPAGGLISSGPDLAKLYRMCLNNGAVDGKKIVSPESLKAMTTVHTGDLKAGFTPGSGWGLGFGIVVEPVGPTAMLSPGTYGHGGAFGTQAWIDPKREAFYVLLIQRVNLGNSDGSKIREEFQKAAVGSAK